jgi:tRNA threonylcarbamoyladenosine biosynthesis protein TsaB
MMILALEFSSPQRSVAVWRAGGGHGVAEAVETGGHATNAFAMVEKVLSRTGIEREQIDLIGIGLGPGSYTGIRAAISVAQGWQLARGIKLLGAPSADCLAVQARADKIFGRVGVVIDAQRNELYLATYEIGAEGWREIEPLKILPVSDVQARARLGEILIGPEVTRWFATSRTLFPRAAALAELAAGRGDFTPGEKLEPIYLRETNFVKAAAVRGLPY